MKKKLLKWFYPVLALVLFGTILTALLVDFVPSTADVFFSTATGMLSYSIMLTLVLIAVRPKAIEKELGLTDMYEIHGWLAMALPITLLVHVGIRWSGLENILTLDLSPASMWGWGGLLALIVVMLTGILVLSDTFISWSDKLIGLKENKFKRNFHLWLHRLSIVSIIFIHFHIYNVNYIRNNVPLRALVTTYTVIVLGWYFIYKIRLGRLPKYEIANVTKPTPDIYEVSIKTDNAPPIDYEPGQYAFFRFVDSKVSSEAHPFSFSSAPEHTEDTVEIMVKESGDFTSTLDQVEAGDKLTIEGPYGNYYPEEEKKSDDPIVLLSGGIGVTPNFSILRHEMAVNSDRRIAFVWGLDMEDDMMYIDELEQMAEENENFTFHLIFSGEEVEGYPYGFVDDDFIRDEGLEEFYQTANWHVCGPPPMLEASKGLMADQDVDDDRQYVEEFAF
jgi:predicted ferric reductase